MNWQPQLLGARRRSLLRSKLDKMGVSAGLTRPGSLSGWISLTWCYEVAVDARRSGVAHLRGRREWQPGQLDSTRRTRRCARATGRTGQPCPLSTDATTARGGEEIAGCRMAGQESMRQIDVSVHGWFLLCRAGRCGNCRRFLWVKIKQAHRKPDGPVSPPM